MYELDKLKLIFDLIKWFISGVVIVIVSLVIDSRLKDRSLGIDEFQVYNQYVTIILEADNIEQRYRLAEYFAEVTPTERLRERWVAYKNLISKDYYTFKKNKNSLNVEELDETPLIGNKNKISAVELEAKAFDYLINRDVDNAILMFKATEESFNGYHSAYEIHVLLKNNKDLLINSDSDKWNEIYIEILEKYSWGVSENLINELKKKTIF